MKEILSYLSSYFDESDIDRQRKNQENFLKECEEIVTDYVSNNVKLNTNKVRMFKDLEKIQAEEGIFYKQETCQPVENIMPGEITEKILKILKRTEDENDIKDNISVLLQNVFSDMFFLSSISVLQSVFEKKELELKKQEYYESLLCKYKNLSKVMELLDVKDNIFFDEPEEDLPVCKDCIIDIVNNVNNLFNIRNYMQKKIISLSPEGHKLQNYIKSKKEKVYSKEDMENIIYKNSHKLLQSFDGSPVDMTEEITIIPLSSRRNRMLSYEYKRVYKKFKKEDSFVFDINKSLVFNNDNNHERLFAIEAGGEAGGYSGKEEPDKDFPGTFGRYFAKSR